MTTETLVDGYTYVVLPDADDGDLEATDTGGLYHRDTRYLSELSWSVGDEALNHLQTSLLSPNERREMLAPATSAVNSMAEGGAVPKHTDWFLVRRLQVQEGIGCRQTVTVHNHTPAVRSFDLRVAFGADFADLFEVRGLDSGLDRAVETERGDDWVRKQYTFEHDGDRTTYTTTVGFDSTVAAITDDEARLSVDVEPHGTATVATTVGIGPAVPDPGEFDTEQSGPEVPTTRPRDERLEGVVEQAAADLAALTTETEHGPVPLAGTPWFVTPFGRDSLIAAYQALPVAPALARGTLRYLAAHQGQTTDAFREEAPGKILHEHRHGELAARGQIPHTPYYGTIDATALWVLLLSETVAWQRSPALAEELAEPLAAALDWIYRTSSSGPDDPFLYYTPSDTGLEHKGWKDTSASVRFADGSTPEGPLAVAEIQGYAVAALERGSRLLETVSDVDGETVTAYSDRATAIRERFDDAFWLPERSFYGLARTGDGETVDALTSNVGHCLWTGLIPEARAASVVERLDDAALSGGWGIRTMSTDDGGYSPISYHAGGVWPHDTSLVALGLTRYGHGDVADRLGQHVLEAGTHFRNQRLPELYCGFSREDDPVHYPAACTPQAWGAGAPFAFLRASFDLQPTDDGLLVTRDSTLFSDAALGPVRDNWGDVEHRVSRNN